MPTAPALQRPMSPALVSVVIPCYRHANYLGGAVQSVLAQSYPEIQTIVVNDGSDDDTEAVARSFGDRIEYVWKPNGGLPSARNVGIAAARGTYVLFLDSDDLLDTEAIGQLVVAMDQSTDRLAVMGHHYFRDDPRQDAGPACLPPASDGFFPWLIVATRPPHAFLCPRTWLDKVGRFEEQLRSAEDWDLWLRLARAGIEYRPCNFAGAYYRLTPGSMSRQHEQMATYAAIVLLRFVDSVRQDESFVHSAGPALLRSAYAIRRRFRIHGLSSPSVAELNDTIRWLHRLGIRANQPLNVYIQDRLPYRWEEPFERACLAACRIVRPNLYADLTGQISSGLERLRR